MPHRLPKTGTVIRPSLTEGWHWVHELEASQRAGLIKSIEWYEWQAYVPTCNCPPPLAEIETLYNDRLKVGKNTPNGVAKKLGYNSMYGKTAQSIGDPKFANAFYASLITAGCRCMILDAIATHPDGPGAVLMVATDGIYFTSPHPILPLSKTELGKWECTERSNMTLFKPGCYWDDEKREKIHNDNFKGLKLKSRGINMKALALHIDELDRQFAAMKEGDPWPSMKIRIPFSVISPMQALQRHKWSLCGKVSTSRTSNHTSDPRDIKRHAEKPGWSMPMQIPTPGLETTYYDKSFGEKEEQKYDHLHPDGAINEQINFIVKTR